MSYQTKWTNTSLRRKVFAKTKGRCFYCGIHIKCNEDDLIPRDWLLVRGADRLMAPDHAHPKIRGGSDGVENRLPSCRGCNTSKGALTVDEFRFVRALRERNWSLVFPSEPSPKYDRDWLCIYSDGQERSLFSHNFPEGAGAYSRGGLGRYKANPKGVRPK